MKLTVNDWIWLSLGLAAIIMILLILGSVYLPLIYYKIKIKKELLIQKKLDELDSKWITMDDFFRSTFSEEFLKECEIEYAKAKAEGIEYEKEIEDND